jgi:hypothetical protein
LVPARLGGETEVPFDPRPTCRPHRLPPLRGTEQRDDALGQCRGVPRGHQEACPAIVDDFWDPTDRGSHHGPACGHGFQSHIGQSFGKRRQDDHVKVGQVLVKIRAKPSEHKGTLQLSATDLRVERIPSRPVTKYDKSSPWTPREHLSCCIDKNLEPFFWTKAARRAHDAFRRRWEQSRETLAELGLWFSEAIGAYGILNHSHFARADSVASDFLSL